MDKDRFLRIQFESLRDEIRDTKSRIFKTIIAGLTVVPAANVLGTAYEVDVVTISLPILVLVIGLVYLSENHALMRCGRYIHDHIETETPDAVGWESWLRAPDAFQKRTTDKLTFQAFYLLYLVYFLGSSWLATSFVTVEYGALQGGILAGAYIAILCVSAIYLYRNQRTSTTTANERVE